VGFDELYGYGLFSFNPDGGKAVSVTAGEKYCLVNEKKMPMPTVTTVNNGQMCGSFNSLADILGSDTFFVPAGFEDNKQDKLLLWS
jgi:hypothetical protein